MFDFSSLNGVGQQNSLSIILFSLTMTIILSLLLVFTYEKTSSQVSRLDHFIQSLLLLSIVTCTIMQSIGNNLALSFGIFGALAIIRFRTRISDPRDVSFVFASMAIGIACGVHSFLNGIVGTIVFCLVAVILFFSPFGQKNNMVGNLRILLPNGDAASLNLHNLLKGNTSDFSVKRIKLGTLEETLGKTEYEYKLVMKPKTNIFVFKEELAALSEAKILRFSFEDENDVEVI